MRENHREGRSISAPLIKRSRAPSRGRKTSSEIRAAMSDPTREPMRVGANVCRTVPQGMRRDSLDDGRAESVRDDLRACLARAGHSSKPATPAKLCKATATRFVAFATVGGNPAKMSSGRVRKEPPPAMLLTVPAKTPPTSRTNSVKGSKSSFRY